MGSQVIYIAGHSYTIWGGWSLGSGSVTFHLTEIGITSFLKYKHAAWMDHLLGAWMDQWLL